MSDEGSRASKQSLLGDVLTFLKTQQRAEEIALAALRKAGEGYLDGEPMKAFNERVDLIARIERLPVETAALRCGCGANKWRCDNCDGLPVETCGDVSGEMTCKLPKGHRAMHQDCHPRTGEYLTWSSEKTTRELSPSESASFDKTLARSPRVVDRGAENGDGNHGKA